MSLSRRAKKRDLAEAAILEALAGIRDRAGHEPTIIQMDWLDLLVGFDRRWRVFEVKTGNAKLLPHQEARIVECREKGLPCHIVRTPEEALAALDWRNDTVWRSA